MRIYSFINGMHPSEKTSGDSSQDEFLNEGIKKWYYANGNIKLETYHKNGKLEGIANYYYESGKLKAREFYKDNQLHGLSKWYYETGEVKSERYYKDGALTVRKEFDKSGNLLSNNLTD